MRLKLFIFLILTLLVPYLLQATTTGKITGIVKDVNSGEPLPGVNIIIKDQPFGAASDIDGYFVIMNVPPGNYILEAIMIGYATYIATGVKINIDQTSIVNIDLQEETMEVETIEVIAKRPIVQKDVAASRVNLSREEFEAIPVATVSSVIGLQAGVEGLNIRGGGLDEVAVMVDGITMRDERDNQPYVGISLTSVEEIQVQAGGFNAEFGNIRSGVVNIVTKEGNRENYSFSFQGRYRPAASKHFGHEPNSPESYWIKPFIDDAVCWTGTDNGAWDEFTQKQFPAFKGGWNKISKATLQDDDPTNDLTADGAQRVFLWEHRKKLSIESPDYDYDLTFSGPVPFVNKELGNLRFSTSYRSSQKMYIIPVSDDAYREYNWQMKITSDVGKNMKLMISSLIGRETGTADNNSGTTGIFKSTWEIPSYIDQGFSYAEGATFGTDYWSLSAVDYTSVGIKFTHALSPNTFYEARLNRFTSEYDTYPGALRNTDKIYEIVPGYYANEAPFGLETSTTSKSITGMNMDAGFANSRDSSYVASYNAKFDLASQLNRYNYFKIGAEFNFTQSQVNYAQFDAGLKSRNQQTKWDRTPVRGALYFQDKLEWEGMIAQVGLRMDYSNAGGDWYAYQKDFYNAGFSGPLSNGIDTLLQKEPTKHLITFSPRLAISFPITEDSKIYFNYGHFRQLPTPENLYLLRRSGFDNSVNRIASPNNPLEKTVAYELGYEHNLFDQFLIRTAGYYKDETDQAKTVRYVNEDGSVDYYVSEPNFYKDTRGVEIQLTKNRGNWVRGFINYTYMLYTYGYFGYGTYHLNPAEQRDYERGSTYYYQKRPVARPYARANLDLFTPQEFGPEVLKYHLLEDWRLNILASWKTGSYESWGGRTQIPGIINNLQWRDNWYCDIRLAKNFHFSGVNVEFFVDIDNIFNIKLLRPYGFVNADDKYDYISSLHLPGNTEGVDLFGYANIPGDDQPGDYRKAGVDFVPIVATQSRDYITNPNSKYLYYESNTKEYLRYSDGNWVNEDSKRVEKILDDKAYIDMPNLKYFTFLNPRNLFWGLKLSFDL
jgi:carboxypeptidase-like protein/TonB-dependent receptor-like protein